MSHEFTIDLKCARRNSGLTQDDCGHLLGGDRSRIKQLETGARLPTLSEICTLSLIFGRSFESLFTELFIEIRNNLSERLGALPSAKGKSARTFNREGTLDILAERLLEETGPRYDV